MIDKNLVNYLTEQRIINKNFIFWWQLGFEGRRIYSKEEFDKTIKEIIHRQYTKKAVSAMRDKVGVFESLKGKGILFEDAKVKIWPNNDVPILLDEVSYKEKSIPSFT